jgi:Protein of unknown function (DUF4232)
MNRYGHIGWRIVALVAFAGTAVLAVILSRVPAVTDPAAGAACPASGLQAWLGLGGGTTAGTYYTLEFTNVSNRSCRLYGYPQVSAYADTQVARGRAPVQVGSDAVRDTSVRPRPVMLPPGATAHAVLRVAETGSLQSQGCSEMTAEELRVSVPDAGRPAFVPVRVPVCVQPGHAFLAIQAIQARPGVPGYLMP